MDYATLFYWLTVADNAKTFFGVFAIFFTAVFLIVTGVRFFSHLDGPVSKMDGDSDEYKHFITKCNKWTWYATPLMLLFLSLWIFTPNKKDALLIVAGGQTLNFLSNDESAKKIPAELANFVLTEVKHMAKEAEVDLGIEVNKQKMLDKAKEMTAEELIKQMQIDSTFSKIILEK